MQNEPSFISRKDSIIYIFLIALAIRLVVAFLPTVPVSDCKWYHDVAVSIAGGDGFSYNGAPTAYRTPGYPFVLGALYFVFGNNPFWGRLLNAIIGAISIALIWMLGKRLNLPKTGILAALLLAFYPEHILLTNALMREPLLAFLILGWLLVITQKGKVQPLWSGFLIGVAAYIRSTALPLALLPIIWEPKQYKKHIISFAIAVVMLTPWAYRNYKVLGAPMIETTFWTNLWIGNGSNADGGYNDTPEIQVNGEIEQERYFKEKLFQDLRNNPFRPLLLIPQKLFHFAFPSLSAVKWGLAGVLILKDFEKWRDCLNGITISNMLSPEHLPIVLGGILTIVNFALIIIFVIALLRRRVPSQAVWTIVYFTAISLVFFGNDRFRFPVLPLMIFGAVALWEKRKK